jgi:transcriptional regulator with GAF, ATPase, and Fis domain
MSANALCTDRSHDLASGVHGTKHIVMDVARRRHAKVVSREGFAEHQIPICSSSHEDPLTPEKYPEDVKLPSDSGLGAKSNERQSFEGMVGSSRALGRTLEQVMTVAPTDATVLIQGETGTGKELVARAIHNLSPRRDCNFVRFNCAAIPLGLLESELFGHEKGAFTGAITRKIGRFELANKGTLFLDEIGDIPLELQAKLLRVLQEQEFERLGSNQTQQVNVRIVAATHRDLKQMVDQRQFRNDLYFRLDIFPITVPPLRQRREDVPSLVKAFAEDCIRRMNREVRSIPADTMRILTEYDWPGNIRELQNFIERAVIVSPGAVLRAPLESLRWSEQFTQVEPQTLAQGEYEHILRVLKETDWVVGGPAGAAKKLGLKRTTLIGKIRRLGLSRSTEARLASCP